MKTYFFTGTGNSLQVARGLGAEGELISIPRFLREHNAEKERIMIADEAIGLVFPTFWMAVPPLVVEFLERVRFECDYLFVVTTRGNASLTLKSHLLQVARKNGHAVSYFNKLTMPDNYLPLFDMARQKLRFSSNQLSRRIEAIAADVQTRKHNVSGIAGLTFIRPALVGYASKVLKDYYQHFYVEDSCNGCGICVQLCSAQSIRLVDGAPVYGSTCSACLSCVHNCPTAAIRMKKEKANERYLNPTVRVKDIIEANSL